MATVHAEIDDRIAAWIARQHMFFVATAPSGDGGHVNLSPKGARESFAVLGPLEVAYVDLYGSGTETIAHVKENGRIVVMFCAFEGPPKIIRLHGTGDVVEQADPRFAGLFAHFTIPDEVMPTVRSIIRIDVQRVADSCGFVVPEMTYVRDRKQLFKGAAAVIRQNGPDAIRDYCDVNNRESIDGLPGLTPFGDGVDEETRRRFAHEGRKL
jgi:Pyridoxamine 5'-phosphate oxidase